MMPADMPPDVAQVYGRAEGRVRTGMLALRNLIYRTAEGVDGLGPVTEALRWGQPSYFAASGVSTPLRVAPFGLGFALFAHCQSRVIENYASWFEAFDRIEGRRAVVFDTAYDIEPDRLTLLIGHALTYHSARSKSPDRSCAA